MSDNPGSPPATLPFGNPATAKVLLIGHDPRLQKSDTIAEYALYADYYFRFPEASTYGPHKAKYGLAKKAFDYVAWLTCDRYTADQVLVTNLCNVTLPHAPKGRIVYIPEQQARDGIAAIREPVSQGHLDVIFAMSQQVNYWLMALGFCEPDVAYLRAAAPKAKGVDKVPPYYEPAKPSAFKLICGRRFLVDGRVPLIPVPHVKNYPLNKSFAAAYGDTLSAVRESYCR